MRWVTRLLARGRAKRSARVQRREVKSSSPPLNLPTPSSDLSRGVVHAGGEVGPMKIALLAILGLLLGALGGAALGIGAGLAWVKIFKTTDFEGYSGMLVFFTFMPLGAVIGGIGGAVLFGLLAMRDNSIAIDRERVGTAQPVNYGALLRISQTPEQIRIAEM